MSEVKPTGQRTASKVAKTATKPSPSPLQKHFLGGCNIDMPPSNCHRHQSCDVDPGEILVVCWVLSGLESYKNST